MTPIKNPQPEKIISINTEENANTTVIYFKIKNFLSLNAGIPKAVTFKRVCL